MAEQTRATTSLLFLFLITLVVQPKSSDAAVVVFDQVTGVGRPVFIKAVTRGLFLTKGGQRVAIRIDNSPAHETLSGADGAAYLKYHPDKPGFHEVTAVSGNEEGAGIILVLEPDEAVVVIGVEGGLLNSLFSEEKRRVTREVVKWLNRSYKLVYLTRWIGGGLVKNRLKKEQFPRSVVLQWSGESVFKRMADKGVRVEMVIGSGALLQAAPDSIEKRFTFDKKEEDAVSGWEDIRKSLEERSGKTDRGG